MGPINLQKSEINIRTARKPTLSFMSPMFLRVTLDKEILVVLALEYHISVALSNIKTYNLDFLLETNKRSLTFLMV